MNLNPKNVQKELSVKDKQKSKGKENVDAISGLEVEEGISTSIQLPSLDYLLTQQTVSWYSISYAQVYGNKRYRAKRIVKIRILFPKVIKGF